MEFWQKTKGEFKTWMEQTHGRKLDTRYVNQSHRNIVANALGQGLDVPKRVMNEYSGYDFTSHPQYRAGGKGKLVKKEKKEKAPNLYGVGMAILATSITGLGDDKR